MKLWSCAARTIPQTRGGNAPDGRKVQATLHWVCAADAVACRGTALQSAFCTSPSRMPSDFVADLNPHLLELITDARLEPALAEAKSGHRCSSSARDIFAVIRAPLPARLIFNRTVGLRDTWAKDRRGTGA